jgi:hypothetical protein
MQHLLTRENILIAVKELLWLGITALVTAAALYPVTQKILFIYYNISFAFIFIMLTYFRWIITLSALPFFRPAAVRFLLFTLNIVLFFFLLREEQKLLEYLDNFYTEDFGFPKIILYDHLKEELFRHLRIIVVFCGTGSLLMLVALNFRLIISWWQFYKYKSDMFMD